MTTCDFIAITDAIAVGILNGHAAVAVTHFTVAVSEYTITGVRSSRIVVTSIGILTTDDLVSITNAIAIGILDSYASVAVAHLAVAVSENTVASISCRGIVVTS